MGWEGRNARALTLRVRPGKVADVGRRLIGIRRTGREESEVKCDRAFEEIVEEEEMEAPRLSAKTWLPDWEISHWELNK
jgi:hypothetical protein